MKATTKPCPVLPLAHEYDRLTRAYHNIDAGSFQPKNEELEQTIIWDRLEAILWQASFLSPRSNDGAAFQVMLAGMLVDRIVNGRGKVRRKEATSQMARILYAVVEYLASGDQRMADVSEYLMGSHIDPHVKLAEIEARQ